MKIAVVYSLPTKRALASKFADTEADTVDSAMEVFDALKAKRATVVLIPIDEHSIAKIADIRADCIFNLIDWTGLDLPLSAKAFARIEQLGIPVTGATRDNYLTTSDKITMKKELDKYHLQTARWQVFAKGTEKVRRDFRYPVIVKLALEHCSIGLSHDAVVTDAKELGVRVRQRIQTYREPVLAEEFLDGREFQVTVLETANGPIVLPPAEIVFETKGTNALLTYASRWEETHPDYKTSRVAIAKLPRHTDEAIKNIAAKTFIEVGFRDYMRLDMRMRGDELFILEANSNPGLSHSEEYGMSLSYMAMGWTFADFVWKIVQSAMRRSKQNPRG